MGLTTSDSVPLDDDDAEPEMIPGPEDMDAAELFGMEVRHQVTCKERQTCSEAVPCPLLKHRLSCADSSPPNWTTFRSTQSLSSPSGRAALAVGESVILLLHLPPPLVGVSIAMEIERQENDSTLADRLGSTVVEYSVMVAPALAADVVASLNAIAAGKYMDYIPTRWTESPRIVVKCDT